MDETTNGQPESEQGSQAEQADARRRDLPKLRPHTTAVRTILYRGYQGTVEQILRNSLPDGIYLSEDGTATIEVRSSQIETEQPERVQVTKAALLQRAKAEHEASQQKPRILNPHTLRPVN